MNIEAVEAIELSGEAVKITPMTLDHVSGLFEAGNDQRIWSYMPMNIKSAKDMDKLVHQALQDKKSGTAFPFAIMDSNSKKLIGSTRFLDISVPNRNLEIGWTWLSPAVWRSKVNTECKYLLLKYCFETLETIRVQIKTDERNTRSQQAIERLGAVKEGILRNHRILADGFYRNTVCYSIIEKEWPAVKARLERHLKRN
ncbi:RimJ/RimL family protein N-acetyltransferase [Scopulibacillus darangshiensis]|uniref:RimJ/RimL family protein N-acetyltransferase n=1 Tax=Scopulibacillus darangshiensis TaxID=442528 RepID=A0A4V2SNB5_9BACL|nr:GNAT family protein [Scopulibacillus darangshiensis]TCP30596.1 RimJ/RimL family protein N-acetyltransferase [Scopulibacillus darangshiensis]